MSGFFSALFGNGAAGGGTPMVGGSVAPNAAPQAATQTQQQPTGQQPQQTQQNQQVQQTQQNQEPEPSSLDKLAALWNTPTTPDGKPATPPADPLSQPVFTLDPAKVQESINKIDFAATIPAEVIQKAQSGDAGAFLEALNIGIRNAVSTMTVNTGNMVNQAMLANNQRVTSALPGAIKATQLNQMQDENPVLNHPAAQPLVAALKQMAFQRNPNASPQEVHQQVSQYFSGLATAIVENSPDQVKARQAATKSSKDTDFSLFMQ